MSCPDPLTACKKNQKNRGPRHETRLRAISSFWSLCTVATLTQDPIPDTGYCLLKNGQQKAGTCVGYVSYLITLAIAESLSIPTHIHSKILATIVGMNLF